MSELEFEEESIQLSSIPHREANPPFTRFLMGAGLAKTKFQANIILLVVTLTAFTLAVIVFISFVL